MSSFLGTRDIVIIIFGGVRPLFDGKQTFLELNHFKEGIARQEAIAFSDSDNANGPLFLILVEEIFAFVVVLD